MYNAARTSIEGREEKLMAAYELIEKNLVLLGATAIEDKLQVRVGVGWLVGGGGTEEDAGAWAWMDGWLVCGGWCS